MNRRYFMQSAVAAGVAMAIPVRALTEVVADVAAVTGDGNAISLEQSAVKELSDALRGNLLLRTGRLDDANQVFREVRREFGPVRRSLDEVAEAHPDLSTYFRQLVRDNMEDFDANDFLPEAARRWSSFEGSEFDRALRAALADVDGMSLIRVHLGQDDWSTVLERLAAQLGANV